MASDFEAQLHHHQSMGHPLPPTPPQTEPLPCPRCYSIKTKFCYYNNYNLSQPRHFCKSCRRYWTQGGTLRDVPVGGGSRKNSKRSRSSSSSSSPSATTHEHWTENPISILAGVNLDSSYKHLNLFQNMSSGLRSCTSQLNSHNSGLLSLTGYDEMSYGLGRGGWSYPEVGDDLVGVYSGASAWNQNNGEAGEIENECLAWPGLAISMESKSLK